MNTTRIEFAHGHEDERLTDQDVAAKLRLMKAAPKLLAALKRIEQRIAYYASLAEGDAPNIEQWAYTDQSGDMREVRAAIAEAEGRSLQEQS